MSSAPLIRLDQLQHPLWKAAATLQRQAAYENYVDVFVFHLLTALGFNDGWLFTEPQCRLKFFMNNEETTALPDFAVRDIFSHFSMCVVEDKSIVEGSTVNSEPQVSHKHTHTHMPPLLSW